MIRVRPEPLQFGIGFHGNVRMGLHRLSQQSLKVRLMKAVAGVPAVVRGLLRPRPIQQQAAIAIYKPHTGVQADFLT